MRCMARGSAVSVLGAVGMALHHKLCHVLGGAFNLPHAETHTDRSAACRRVQRRALRRKRCAGSLRALGVENAARRHCSI